MIMEDPSKQPPSFGSGAQRSPHPRPFFFVQPPSQPYYLCQSWQLTNPYSHFGLPAGFNFGRPSLHPYPYMPYPGFVLPHAPIYPLDYRRMFEPRFQAPAWSDVPRQQYHPQPQGHRETACSGAQTDPSDTINKLIECLDKIRATELQSTDRELDSGVGSQSSGMFSPLEEKKTEKQGHPLPSEPHPGCLESPGVTSSDSTAAVYDSESSQVILDPLSPQGGWTGRLEVELPLDSSSVHEECPYQLVPGEHFILHETEITDIQSNILVTESSVPVCDATSLPSSPLVVPEAKHDDKVSKAEDAMTSCDQTKADESYQILKLPFDGVLSPGAAHFLSPAAPYYYNYLPMQTTHERMSVLSPSLDELSSRDEMFSTDLDDADLFPNHMYAGRRLSAVIGGSPAADDEEDAWLPKSKRVACACCGKNLEKGMGRSKFHGSKVYHDDAGDSEEEGTYGRGCEQPIRVVVRKHSGPRKAQTVQRHAAKPWHKKGQSKELSGPMKQEESHEVCQQEVAEVKTEELDSRELQCRTCQDGLCKADLTTVGQGRWPDGDVISRRRHAASLQRQEMSAQWKVTYHRPRDDHEGDEVLPLNERGSTVRGEPRC
ncbi:LOW QUALITY PROTEIN: bucky ball [Anableps anableps]